MSLIILNRIAVMLAYMIPGYILCPKRIITDEGANDTGKTAFKRSIRFEYIVSNLTNYPWISL